jgi:hypothetical protein
VEVVIGQAQAMDPEDPLILCIEAGGTVQTQSISIITTPGTTLRRPAGKLPDIVL